MCDLHKVLFAACRSRARERSRVFYAPKRLAKVNILLKLRDLCKLHMCRKNSVVFVGFAQVWRGSEWAKEGKMKRLLAAFVVTINYLLRLSRKKLYEKCRKTGVLMGQHPLFCAKCRK